MTIYGRITEEGLVLEVCELDPATCFHPEIAKEFKKIPAGAAPGDGVVNGKLVKAPEPEPLQVVTPVAQERLVSRGEFFGALLRSERIALESERAANAELNDFLVMLDLNGSFSLDNSEDIDLLKALVTGKTLSEGSLVKIQALR